MDTINQEAWSRPVAFGPSQFVNDRFCVYTDEPNVGKVKR